MGEWGNGNEGGTWGGGGDEAGTQEVGMREGE